MSVNEDFSDNSELYENSKPEDRLNVSTLEKYLNDYGPERLRGYLDALTHLSDSVAEAIYKDISGNTVLPHKPKIAVQNVEQLFSNYSYLKLEMTKLLNKGAQPAASTNNPAVKPE
ncbi:hypothetical protein FAM09_07115 [Niastella caeni]|uniref:Uncharacterized protein n=1 Tax=Niastella caeni TaxID=2569763 RepID=A0A4S8I4V9_9BACT|nr:hypothetical protein [Niastella caeni]THU41862.1 hypothetical protein FAM09_07115 [Niastella caeni]